MIEMKKKFAFPKAQVQEIEYDGQTIKVDPYITDANQRLLIGVYLEELFKDADDKSYNVLNAEIAMMLSLIELCTDIQLVEEEGEVKTALFNINDVLANKSLFTKITGSISNYSDFKRVLSETVNVIMENKKIESSLGERLNNIFIQVQNFLENLDLSPEKIESIKGLLKDVESSEIIKSSLDVFVANKKSEV